MILIGQYDSPFVRRVGIALTLYGIPFEHRPWSVFGDQERVRAVNPVTKVPVLVLAEDDVIIESHMMLDYIDSLVPEEVRMFPAREPERHLMLKVAALGTGLAEKAVSLFYERRLHAEISKTWAERCEMQIRATLAALESQRAASTLPFWSGERIGHADIAVATALRFTRDAHPALIDWAAYPALLAFSNRLEAMDEFIAISQAFVAPA